MIKQISAILLSAALLSSFIIIVGNASGGEGVAMNEIAREKGLGGLWNPRGPKESETCHIISPESLLRDSPRPLPSASDNSAGLPPVGNQRWQGSCTAWAIGYYHATYIENREAAFDLEDPSNQVSPAFLYNIANGGDDGGSYMEDVADLLISNGACSMAEKPYNPSDDYTWPTEDWMWVSGMKRRAASQNWLDMAQAWGMDALKAHLAAGNTATTGIDVWGNFDDIGSYNYTYCSSERTGINRGGHIVTICGYDDDKPTADGYGALRMVNSWGTDWGQSGYWWMSYEAAVDGLICYGWAMYLESLIDYAPTMVTKVQIDHEERGNIIRNEGIGISLKEDGVDVWDKSFLSCYWIEAWYGAGTQLHPFPTGRMAFDISEALAFMNPAGEHQFTFSMTNQEGLEGVLSSFEVINAEWWEGGVSWDAPLAIAVYSTSQAEAWVYPDWFIHLPIRVNGDEDFEHRAIGEFWNGDGSHEEPFMIPGYYIYGENYGYCIYVGNTTHEFTIRDCWLDSASSDEWSDYHADSGINLHSVQAARLEQNSATANRIGIYSTGSSDILAEGNEADANNFGILVAASENTVLRGNNVTGSTDYGICIEASSNVSIYHNNLIDNIIQGYDDTGLNSWDNGYPFGGNYWSDYSGTDGFSGPAQDQPGSDGLGDTPYTFSSNQDNYPLMSPSTLPILAEFEIGLIQGWNLISIPLGMADASVESVFSSIAGKWDVAKCFDGASKTWETYRIGGAQAFTDMNCGMGVWLHATENCTLTVSGEEPATSSITLYAGWNLVGYPSITEISVGDAFWGTGADRVEVSDPASPYLMKEVGPEFLLKPGMGFWVRVPADVEWTINS